MDEKETIAERSEARKEYTWSIDDIYKDDSLWKKDYDEVKKLIPVVKSYCGRLSESADTLFEYLRLNDSIAVYYDKLVNYAHRKRDEDTRNSVYQQMCGQLSALITEMGDASSFEIPEMVSIDPEVLIRFYDQKPELREYEVFLARLAQKKKHILSESEERIMALAGEMQDSPDTIYSIFSDADMTFEDACDSDGKKYPVTHSTYIPLMQSGDRELRKSAFGSMYSSYGKYKNSIAAMLAAQTKQLAFNARVRKYDSTLQASLDGNEVPVCVYHNLIETVHANMSSMHKYMKLRKKLMKVDELHMYDLYTPVIDDFEMKIPFEEAKEEVLRALASLGEDYTAILREGFADRWIDVYENAGKASGAYSAGARVHPFVLLNHKDTLNCEFTLAHEMGHAVHSYLSNKNQPVIYSDYVIFVAEVASTCNEALLMQYMLKNTTDPKKKAYLINYYLEQFRTTLYRQTMFAEFELKINEITENGDGITAENISQIYGDLNRLYFGDDVVIDDEIRVEWARIPHFYYNYYVYQYATGYAAAVALSGNILQNGKPAADAYKKFLSGGCSQPPIELLKIAGVDMTTPQPVDSALKLFDSLIDELDSLLKSAEV
ncbi:MAG: oligoendopeptidase F [Oscillospiraceae bacterium]|nr:oligoendopeptidase F [Oscillospiraceae bacterium]